MEYDLTVIGAGWAGFNAAIRAKELGLKTALIEKGELGGTCLNRGCIPTKALIQSAKVFAACNKADKFGVESAQARVDFSRAQARKNSLVEGLRKAMEFSARGLDLIRAEAKIISAQAVSAAGREVKTKSILLASGSRPVELKGLEFGSANILFSDQLLLLENIPQSLLIIGGGVIGCEFASLFNILGSKVTLVEKMPRLLPAEDHEISRRLEGIFKKKGITLSLNSDAGAQNLNGYEAVLVCVGRQAFTAGLGLEEAGVRLVRGKILVDEYLKTNIPSIYAAGDCTGKIMLAHFADYQAKVAAENIAAGAAKEKADKRFIPNCIFTDPEIASVGYTLEAALAGGIEAEAKKVDFLASGMARILEQSEGFLKVVYDKKSGAIIGSQIIGPKATELISVLTVAADCRLTIARLKEVVFAHPTLSELIPSALK